MSRSLVLALVLAGCASTPLETVFVPITDPSTLEVGYAADTRRRGTIVEYVPVGEKIESWKHLLTVQFLEGDRRSPEILVTELARSARQHGGTLEWNVLERDRNSVLYEWRLLDCPKADPRLQDQSEVARVLRGNDGLHRVAYTERGRVMDPPARERYLEAFRKACVVKGPELEPVALE